MSAVINIIETTTELGIEVVEVVVASSSTPGPAGPGVPTGGTDGQVLTKTAATDYATAWEDPTGGGGGAPEDATYLVTTANGDLTAEVVVGATPGGELGGTWASPTVDATHSGSSHAAVQAAAEATAASELATHAADTTSVHGIADTSALALTANHPSNATFNDHSTRHEDGGADEISIAGLSGTSAALQAHLDDTSDAHDASAISFTPDGSIAATTVQAAIVEVRDEAGGGGAPTDADYLVGTANGGLSNEIVVGTSPGGELGGTWASPTVDASHSGSTHAAVQAAAEATAAAALSAHLTDTSDAHDASAISVDSTTLVGTGTDAQAVFEELDNSIADHIADATAAHAGTAISVDSTNLSGTGTTVQASLEELDNLLDDHSSRHENGGADEISIAGLDGTPTELTNHLNDATDAHDASAISVLDTAGDYTATDVEGVLAEIATQLGGSSSAILFEQTLGSAAASIDTGAGGIAGGYRVLEIYILARTTNAAVQSSAIVTLNNDTGSNYDRDRHAIQNVTAANSAAVAAANWSFFCHGDAGVANYATLIRIVIPFYTSTTFNKVGVGHDMILDDTAAELQISQYSLGWRSTAAITRATVTASPGNLMTGSQLLVIGRS